MNTAAKCAVSERSFFLFSQKTEASSHPLTSAISDLELASYIKKRLYDALHVLTAAYLFFAAAFSSRTVTL